MKQRAPALFAAALACVLSARAEGADPRNQQQAVEHNRAARSHADAGRFADAIREFSIAYELFPHPQILYNLAKVYRRMGDPEKSIFYFKRYLMVLPNAKDRADVERRIHELEDEMKRGTSPAPSPTAAPAAPTPQAAAAPAAAAPYPGQMPTALTPRPGPAPSAPTAASAAAGPAPPQTVAGPTPPAPRDQAQERPAPAEADGSDETVSEDGLREFDPNQIVAEALAKPPKPSSHFRIGLHGGAAVPSYGGATIQSAPVVISLLSATYSMPTTMGNVEVGVETSWTPIGYAVQGQAAARGTTHLLGGYAMAGLRVPLSKSFSLGPVVAFGVLWWTHLGPGNPFTLNRTPSSAIPMGSARISMPATWKLGSTLFFGFEPTFTFTRTTGAVSEVVPLLSWLGATAVLGAEF
jgi:hypothetical protein